MIVLPDALSGEVQPIVLPVELTGNPEMSFSRRPLLEGWKSRLKAGIKDAKQ
jgi:hypothetical protein